MAFIQAHMRVISVFDFKSFRIYIKLQYTEPTSKTPHSLQNLKSGQISPKNPLAAENPIPVRNVSCISTRSFLFTPHKDLLPPTEGEIINTSLFPWPGWVCQSSQWSSLTAHITLSDLTVTEFDLYPETHYYKCLSCCGTC